jgi:hypothetical protein
MEIFDIILTCSLLINLILGMYFIGITIQNTPNQIKKTRKNETAALFFASIAIGGLFGFLGNLLASCLFEFLKISSWVWAIPLIFTITLVTFLWVVIKTTQYTIEFMR